MSKMLSLALGMVALASVDMTKGQRGYNDIDLNERLDVPPSFRDDDTMHEFIIHGVKITARNRKIAEKIYRNQRSTSKTVNNG